MIIKLYHREDNKPIIEINGDPAVIGEFMIASIFLNEDQLRDIFGQERPTIEMTPEDDKELIFYRDGLEKTFDKLYK